MKEEEKRSDFQGGWVKGDHDWNKGSFPLEYFLPKGSKTK